MISAFGIDHGPIAKSVIGEAYHAGRAARGALEAKKLTGELGGAAFKEQKRAAGAFNAAGEGSFAQKAAQHVGFHRNAYVVGAGALKEGAAVGAGVAAWQQRKKRKAMGQPAPAAPIVEALAKRRRTL